MNALADHCQNKLKPRHHPAMAAGITDRLWGVEDIAALVEAAAPKPGKRGLDKKFRSRNLEE